MSRRRKSGTIARVVFRGGSIVLPDSVVEGGWVFCEGARIVDVGRGRSSPPSGEGIRSVDARGGFISPGFVDLHVHGGGGADFMDGTTDAVRVACRAHATTGTTTLFPTTTTGSQAQIMAMLHACRQVRDAAASSPASSPDPSQSPRGTATAAGARIGGAHVYGPYFAVDKTGCHAAETARAPDPREYRAWFRDGLVRVATCAAELPGASAFYRAARRAGCLVTCGHSNADWEEMNVAFGNGMRHVDHFWCAMSSVQSLRRRFGTPMRASMEQFVLAHEQMSTEVIADGEHLSPELLAFALRSKGPERLCLVTDASRAMGMPPGRYRFGPVDSGTWFESDGSVGRSGESLASSVRGMDHMVRQMLRSTGAPLADVVRMASLTPAERVGMDHEIGSLAAGKRADVVILSRRLVVRDVFIGGIRFGGSGKGSNRV